MKIKLVLIILAALITFSCQNREKPLKEEFNKEKSISLNKSDDNMAPVGEKKEMKNKQGNDDFITGDTTSKIKRKFVRTAEMKYKVKDVIKASSEIEKLTNSYNGFITYSNLRSAVTGKNIKNISSDSLLETVFYTVSNEINIRVPNTALDSLLIDLNKLIDFLDYKIIKADDVSMLIYSNQLNQNRINKYQNRLSDAIDNKGKKLSDIINAEEKLLNKMEQSDFYKTSNMNLFDQVAFSTLIMNIYQREVVKREIIENFDNIREQKPGFFHRIWNSIKIGWSALEDIIVGLFVIWWLIILLIAGWYFLKKSIKKRKIRKLTQQEQLKK